MALIVWLPLNGTLENQGLSSLVPSGTPTFLNNGKIGKCISLTPRVSFTGLPKLEKFTILFWLKVDSCTTDWSDSLLFRDYTSADVMGSGFRFEATQTTRACSFHDNTGYAVTKGSRILITNSQYGEWHHCGFSCDGQYCYTYIDGILTYTDTAEGGYLYNYFHIGETDRMVGGMNDLRVYDEVLSDKQIKEIAKGLCAHYRMVGTGTNKNLLTNSYVENRNHSSTSYPCAAYPLESAVTANKKYTVSVNATFTDAYVIGLYFGGGSYGTQWVNCSQNGTYTLSWTFTANSNMAAQNFVNIYVRDSDNTPKIGVAKCIVHWVKLEEGEIVTSWIPNITDALYTTLGYDRMLTHDVSGYGYNGTQSGTLTFNNNSPRYTGSTNFSGPGYLHYLLSPLNSSTDAFTFTCWFYPTQNSTMAIYNDRTAVGEGFSVFYVSSGIRFDTGANALFQAGSINVNNWNFIVCVYDKNNNVKKTYINGVEAGSTTTLGNLNTIGTNASIGNSSTNGAAGAGNQVYGSLSDVRIYCTALSAEDILKLYEISGIIDNKENTYSYEFIEED